MAAGQGFRGLEKAAGLVKVSLYSREAVQLMGYPGGKSRVFRVAAGLRECGVDGFVSAGNVSIDGFKVVGKGHSSIVVLGSHDGRGVVAVKVRRIDSKHPSLRREAVLQEEASRAGVAPRVYCFSDDFIVMDYIDGVHLGDAVLSDSNVSRVLEAAYILDVAGVNHKELSRPWRHVLLLDSRAVIIDYGSAGWGGCRNLPRIASALSRRIGLTVDEPLRMLLREYRRGCSRRLYREIYRVFLSAFHGTV